MTTQFPRIAIMLGDRNGIGPELCARLVESSAFTSRASLVLVGDASVFQWGCRVAKVSASVPVLTELPAPTERLEPAVLLDCGFGADLPHTPGQPSAEAGSEMLRNLAACFEFASGGLLDGVVVAPLNKAAMRSGGLGEGDELDYLVRRFRIKAETCELNELNGLWTSRVTAHVPLSAVATQITQDRIVGSIRLIDQALRAVNGSSPRIAVAGLNPHAGDDGAFGREEIDQIRPAIERCRGEGINVDGPFPADTIFVRAQKEGFAAVVTMYHDQGQIALKLLGFGKGVTVMSGLPFPMTTPSHGTAYDIVGRGIAEVAGLRRAVEICLSLQTCSTPLQS